MAARVVAPSEFVRLRAAMLALSARKLSRRPAMPPTDDPEEEKRRVLAERPDVQTLWHATTPDLDAASLSEWDDCGEEEGWIKGSGWYQVVDHTGPLFRTHYRRDGDREDAPRTSADPNGARDRAATELWNRMRVEGADRYAEVRELRAALRDSQATIATHLATIAQKDARIAALEASQVPAAVEPSWLQPVGKQLAGYLEEARPLLGPLAEEFFPVVRAEVQDRLSHGAYVAGLLSRLAAAQPVLKRLLDSVRDAGGFALQLPDPTEEQIQAHHCPRAECEAEAGEPCLDGETPTEEPHAERVALARLPRALKTAIKAAGAELVLPGLLVTDDPAVLAAARDLCVILEMDAWEQAQAAVEIKALDAAPSPPAEEPEPPPPSAPRPVAPPPPAETEEEEEPGDVATSPTEPPPHDLKPLETAAARAEWAARVAARAVPLADDERAARLVAAKAKARASFLELEAQREAAKARANDLTHEPTETEAPEAPEEPTL